jgi:hypothetical protein
MILEIVIVKQIIQNVEFVVLYLINCYYFLSIIHMDCDDHMNYGNDDHNYDKDDNDDGNDDEFYQLVSAGCCVVELYAIKHIDKQPCRNSKETGFKWMIHTWSGNETKCHDMLE